MAGERDHIHSVNATCLGVFGGWTCSCSCGKLETNNAHRGSETATRLDVLRHLWGHLELDRAREYALHYGLNPAEMFG